LLERVGVGGFGEVYLAKMTTTSGFTKRVALKLLRPELARSPNIIARLQDEARILGLLSHRAIVEADDLVTLGGRLAVVMEYIPGENLSALLSHSRFPHELPVEVSLRVIEEIADALETAHSRPSPVTGEPLGLLHRDIKPANIRLTPEGRVKILDFGIARSDRVLRAAQTGDVTLGSLNYMAPELLLGQPATVASDAYALGITLYEMLARTPFGLAGDAQPEHDAKVARVLSGISRAPLSPDADEILELLERLLGFDATRRPTIAELNETCHALLQARPALNLRTWSGRMVPQVIAKPGSEGAGDVGQTLLEDGTLLNNLLTDMDGAAPTWNDDAYGSLDDATIEAVGPTLTPMAADTIRDPVEPPVGTPPSGSRSAESRSAGTRPAGTRPADTLPVESRPVESRPVETLPEDPGPRGPVPEPAAITEPLHAPTRGPLSWFRGLMVGMITVAALAAGLSWLFISVKLEVTGTPMGATATLNGETKTTPATFTVDAERVTHRVALSADGHRSTTKECTITRGVLESYPRKLVCTYRLSEKSGAQSGSSPFPRRR